MQKEKNYQLWKIIARAVCPKRTHKCEACVLRSNCVRRAKDAAARIERFYFVTPKNNK